MTVNLIDPWLVARSRALHAELDASPGENHGDIMERHARAAVAERPDFLRSEVPEADMVTALYSASLRVDDPEYEAKWLAGFMEWWTGPVIDAATMTREAFNARQVEWRKRLVDIGACTPEEAERLLPPPPEAEAER